MSGVKRINNVFWICERLQQTQTTSKIIPLQQIAKELDEHVKKIALRDAQQRE